MGFFVLDPDTGAVVSQFPHLFPVSIAIGYGLDGLSGGASCRGRVGDPRRAGGVFRGRAAGRATRGVRPARFSSRSTSSRSGSRATRTPKSSCRRCCFAALLGDARAHVDGDAFFAPVAGSLLGLLLFLRFDAVLGVAAVMAALALMVLAGTSRLRTWFFGAACSGRARCGCRTCSDRCGPTRTIRSSFSAPRLVAASAARGGRRPVRRGAARRRAPAAPRRMGSRLVPPF